MRSCKVFRRLVFVLFSLAALLGSTVVLADHESAPPRAGDICRKVAMMNVVDEVNGVLRPGPEYVDGSWVRDSFWATGHLGAKYGRPALDRFGARMALDGQIPTRINSAGIADQYYDDESTILYIIWAARDGGQPKERIQRAWEWVAKHSNDGYYWTPPGSLHTWHDILYFPSWDVAAYNQGLYALAAQLVADMGIAYPEQAKAAVNAYRSLYRPTLGFMPVSKNLDYHDVSATVGETLARTLFGRKMLTDEALKATVRALPLANFQPLAPTAFKVLAKADGTYLDDWAFRPWSMKGRYQNGGSWLLYDALAWKALETAGDPAGRDMLKLRVTLESYANTFYEYVSTGPASEVDELPVHPDYAWNAYVCNLLPE